MNAVTLQNVWCVLHMFIDKEKKIKKTTQIVS